jgi:tetratricopeptide (TPR) repeat protein
MKFEEAKAIYNQLLELSPDNSEAWHNLGMTNYELARLQLESSRFCLLKALQLDDSVSTYHYSFALIHEAMGDFSLAKQAYHEAIRLKPDDVDASPCSYISGLKISPENWNSGGLYAVIQ